MLRGEFRVGMGELLREKRYFGGGRGEVLEETSVLLDSCLDKDVPG